MANPDPSSSSVNNTRSSNVPGAFSTFGNQRGNQLLMTHSVTAPLGPLSGFGIGRVQLERRTAEGQRILRDNLHTVFQELRPLMEHARTAESHGLSLSWLRTPQQQTQQEHSHSSHQSTPPSSPPPSQTIPVSQPSSTVDSFVITLDTDQTSAPHSGNSRHVTTNATSAENLVNNIREAVAAHNAEHHPNNNNNVEEGESECKQETDAAGTLEGELITESSLDLGGLTEDVGKLRLRKKNICGAEKKRRRRQRLAEAQQLAPEMVTTAEPQSASASIQGKSLLSGSTPKQQHMKKSSFGIPKERNRYAIKIKTGLRIAIVKEGYPQQQLDQEDLEKLEVAIGRLVDELPEGAGPMPQIADCYLSRGAAIIVCNNEESLSWLTSQVSKMDPLKSAKLMVVGLENLPSFKRVMVWIPGPPVDSVTIFQRLEHQNQGISTQGWRIYERKEEKWGIRLVVSLESKMAQQLLTTKKIFCGAHMATFSMIKPKHSRLQEHHRFQCDNAAITPTARWSQKFKN